MSEIMLCKNGNWGMQVIQVLGEPWFILNDVCDCLEIIDSSTAVSGLDDDEYQSMGDAYNTDDKLAIVKGLRRDSIIINESGLYSLIFKSRKQEAKAFKRWVTHEVLPQIRKTGIYISDSLLLRGEVVTHLKAVYKNSNTLPEKVEDLIWDHLWNTTSASNRRDEQKKRKVRQDELLYTIKLPDELAYRLAEIAAASRLKPSDIVENVMTDWLKGKIPEEIRNLWGKDE